MMDIAASMAEREAHELRLNAWEDSEIFARELVALQEGGIAFRLRVAIVADGEVVTDTRVTRAIEETIGRDGFARLVEATIATAEAKIDAARDAFLVGAVRS
jgi:hypothetical protein